MARKVKRRTDYFQDAITVRRIAEAVEADINATPQWKTEAANHLYSAMRLFMEKGVPNGNTDRIAE